MASALRRAPMKHALCMLVGAALPLVVAGCDDPFESKACDHSIETYDIEMTRALSVDGPLDELDVEACVDGRCVSGVVDASGVVTFDRDADYDNASNGVIDRARGTIRVTFSLFERDATTRVLLRVRRSDQQLLAEIGNIHWDEGDCHSTPETTSI